MSAGNPSRHAPGEITTEPSSTAPSSWSTSCRGALSRAGSVAVSSTATHTSTGPPTVGDVEGEDATGDALDPTADIDPEAHAAKVTTTTDPNAYRTHAAMRPITAPRPT